MTILDIKTYADALEIASLLLRNDYTVSVAKKRTGSSAKYTYIVTADKPTA